MASKPDHGQHQARADINPLTIHVGQKRSFLSLAEMRPRALKNLLPQTLGKTLFDFVTFLAVAERPDIRAQRSIGEYGLLAAVSYYAVRLRWLTFQQKKIVML